MGFIQATQSQRRESESESLWLSVSGVQFKLRWDRAAPACGPSSGPASQWRESEPLSLFVRGVQFKLNCQARGRGPACCVWLLLRVFRRGGEPGPGRAAKSISCRRAAVPPAA